MTTRIYQDDKGNNITIHEEDIGGGWSRATVISPMSPPPAMRETLTRWMAVGAVLLGSSVGVALGLWLVRVIA